MEDREKTSGLVWMDLETTGLDPERCQVIEVGWTVTGRDGRHGWIRSAVAKAEVDWSTVDPRVVEMHERSGLRSLVGLSTCAELEAIESAVLEDIEASNFDTVYLAGNGVHFDRNFIWRSMPRLDRRLHYRHLDMTAVRLFLEAVGLREDETKDKPHRAAPDLEASLAQFCRYARLVQVM